MPYGHDEAQMGPTLTRDDLDQQEQARRKALMGQLGAPEIEGAYQKSLGRPADTEGLAAHLKNPGGLPGAISTIENSPEAQGFARAGGGGTPAAIPSPTQSPSPASNTDPASLIRGIQAKGYSPTFMDDVMKALAGTGWTRATRAGGVLSDDKVVRPDGKVIDLVRDVGGENAMQWLEEGNGPAPTSGPAQPGGTGQPFNLQPIAGLDMNALMAELSALINGGQSPMQRSSLMSLLGGK